MKKNNRLMQVCIFKKNSVQAFALKSKGVIVSNATIYRNGVKGETVSVKEALKIVEQAEDANLIHVNERDLFHLKRTAKELRDNKQINRCENCVDGVDTLYPVVVNGFNFEVCKGCKNSLSKPEGK